MKLDNYSKRIQYITNNRLNLISFSSNIVGMGFGYKEINNKKINVPSLTFLVKKKVSVNSLESKHIIPKYISGIVTDIVESGELKPCGRENPVRPIVGGVSIQNPVNKYWGTAGYALTEEDTRKNLYLLTSGHILRSDNPQKEVKIIQPKYQPDEKPGSRGKKDTFGKIHIISKVVATTNLHEGEIDLKKINPVEINELDAGILELGENTEENRKKLLGPGFKDGTKVRGVVPTNEEGIVQISINIDNSPVIFMYGASTGRADGIITINPFTVKMYYETGEESIGKHAYFKNQLVARIPCDYGDSGALGVRTKDELAFGLLMTKNESDSGEPLGIFNPLDTILKRYDMILLS